MAKTKHWPLRIDSHYVYVLHSGPEGPDPLRCWHTVFDGTYDDIYWSWVFEGATLIWCPDYVVHDYAIALSNNPQIVKQMCPACRYYDQMPGAPIKHIPSWQHSLDHPVPPPPAIYWPHPYEWDNNPPGYKYDWQ